MEEIFEFDLSTFKVKNLNIPGIVLIPEFKVLLDKDKSKDKKDSWNNFTFIYLMEGVRSPIRGYSDTERLEEALRASSLKEVSKELQAATDKYSTIVWNTPILRMIKKMRKGVEKLEEYFDVVNFTEKVTAGPRMGALLFAPKELVSIMKDAKEVLEQVKGLEQLAREELQSVSEARGGQEGGIFN